MADDAADRPRATISDVAREAGVSKMTVSRVLNHADTVAPDTLARVQAVIDRMHFRPNAIARGLATRRTNIIGLLVYDQHEAFSFFSQMVLSAQAEAKKRGVDLLIFSLSEEQRHLSSQRLDLVDGMLCLGEVFNHAALELLERRKVPYVVIGKRNWRNIDPWYCCPDYVDGYRSVTEHLLQMGHRRIAMMGGYADFEADIEKYVGYRQALEAAGLPCDPALVVYEEQHERVEAILASRRATAVIVEGYTILMMVLLAARAHGLGIPQDLSVVSSQVDPDAATIYRLTGIHEMTRVHVPVRELGMFGLGLLMRRIEGEEGIPKANVLPEIFVLGESCAPPG